MQQSGVPSTSGQPLADEITIRLMLILPPRPNLQQSHPQLPTLSEAQSVPC
jgi:hypothetical protein